MGNRSTIKALAQRLIHIRRRIRAKDQFELIVFEGAIPAAALPPDHKNIIAQARQHAPGQLRETTRLALKKADDFTPPAAPSRGLAAMLQAMRAYIGNFLSLN